MNRMYYSTFDDAYAWGRPLTPSPLTQAYIGLLAGVLAVALLALLAPPGHAEQGPFAGSSGSWAGGGECQSRPARR